MTEKQYATIRIDEHEIKKLSEELFEIMLINFHVVITQDGKDAVISVPYKEYQEMQKLVEQQTK